MGALKATPSNLSPDSEEPWFRYEARPGSNHADSLTVENTSTQTVAVSLYTADAEKSHDGAFAIRPEGAEIKAAGRWISLDRAQLTLAPHSKAVVAVTLRVPRDAQPGKHYAGILVQEQVPTTRSIDQLSLNVVKRLGVRAYIEVKAEPESSSRHPDSNHPAPEGWIWLILAAVLTAVITTLIHRTRPK